MSDAVELEREAEAARARLSDTAEQIRARMSPGQMMDEVLNQFRGGDGGQMLANLKTQARDNPMALALIGGGLAWLMMGSGPELPIRSSSGKPSPFPATPSRPLPSHDSQGGTATPPTANAGDANPARPTVAKTSSGALASAREAVGDGLHLVGDRAGEIAQGLQAAGTETLSGIRDSTAGLGHQARRGFLDVLDREPLVIGAIGVAVGAAIGALLPATQLERQHLGTAGEALKNQAESLVEKGAAAVKEASSEIYTTARDEADRQGLRAGDSLIVDKVDAVVRAAGKTAGAIAERHLPESPAQTDVAEQDGSSRT